MVKLHQRKIWLKILQDFSLVALIQSHAAQMTLSACLLALKKKSYGDVEAVISNPFFPLIFSVVTE